MKRAVDIPEDLDGFIRHLSPELKRKVRASLEEISQNPHCGKSLQEELEGLKSYKLGRWRIGYREKPSVIQIVALGPREMIYQKLALELKQAKG